MAAEQRRTTSEQDSALDVAKRVYVYAIAAVGLVLLTVGLANLLELAGTRLDDMWSDTALLVGGVGDVRRQVSVHVAMVLVALPIWMAHWFLAERWATREESERRATIRALYLAAALAVPMIYLATSLRDLLYRLFLRASSDGAEIYGRRNVTEALALLVAAGGVWAYHGWVRRRDEQAGALPGRAQWPSRLYLYLAAFVGAALLLDGVVDLLGVTVEALLQPGNEVVRAERWWAVQLSNALSNALVGLLLWGTHWGHSLRIVAGNNWAATHERRSIIRRAYLYIASFTGVVLALVTVIRILDILFRWILGVDQDADGDLAARLVNFLLRLLPFGVFWFYHRWEIEREAEVFGDAPLQIGVRRLYTYGAALIGLLFAGIGLARLVTVAFAALGSSDGNVVAGGDAWREEVSVFAAVALTGAGAWLWHWYRVQQWLQQDAAAEREATTRRVYLYSALGGAMIAVLGGLSVIVYRVLSALLDVGGRGDFVSDVSGPGGIALVALLILLYHGLILRNDLQARPSTGLRQRTQKLLLAGPPGSDLDAVVDMLQAQLPEGYTLKEE